MKKLLDGRKALDYYHHIETQHTKDKAMRKMMDIKHHRVSLLTHLWIMVFGKKPIVWTGK